MYCRCLACILIHVPWLKLIETQCRYLQNYYAFLHCSFTVKFSVCIMFLSSVWWFGFSRFCGCVLRLHALHSRFFCSNNRRPSSHISVIFNIRAIFISESISDIVHSTICSQSIVLIYLHKPNPCPLITYALCNGRTIKVWLHIKQLRFMEDILTHLTVFYSDGSEFVN